MLIHDQALTPRDDHVDVIGGKPVTWRGLGARFFQGGAVAVDAEELPKAFGREHVIQLPAYGGQIHEPGLSERRGSWIRVKVVEGVPRV